MRLAKGPYVARRCRPRCNVRGYGHKTQGRVSAHRVIQTGLIVLCRIIRPRPYDHRVKLCIDTQQRRGTGGLWKPLIPAVSDTTPTDSQAQILNPGSPLEK